MGVDTDDDGLTDWDEENIYGTKPDNPDTDGDGINDGDEIEEGTDPLVANKSEKPEKSFIDSYWWILLIIAVIIIIFLLFVFSRRKDGRIAKEEGEVEEGPSSTEIGDEDKKYAPENPT
jgi:hypothetical protein